MEFMIYDNKKGRIAATIITDHPVNLDEAIELIGGRRISKYHADDPDYFICGKGCRYEDLGIYLMPERRPKGSDIVRCNGGGG